ncbi:uncharacterized [Tachysurus ichikawai]
MAEKSWQEIYGMLTHSAAEQDTPKHRKLKHESMCIRELILLNKLIKILMPALAMNCLRLCPELRSIWRYQLFSPKSKQADVLQVWAVSACTFGKHKDKHNFLKTHRVQGASQTTQISNVFFFAFSAGERKKLY